MRRSDIIESVYTAPTVPIRLIIAFARDLSGGGVRSGIIATAGDLYIPIETRRSSKITINKKSLPGTFATFIRSWNNTVEANVPINIKGILLPILVFVRSDKVPNKGKRKSANILSSAMIKPVIPSPSPNVYFRIRGISLS